VMVLAAVRNEIYTNTHIIMKLKKEKFQENVKKRGRYEKSGENNSQKCERKI
jgi:uncharacterized protein YaiI (UPF0178 family)